MARLECAGTMGRAKRTSGFTTGTLETLKMNVHKTLTVYWTNPNSVTCIIGLWAGSPRRKEFLRERYIKTMESGLVFCTGFSSTSKDELLDGIPSGDIALLGQCFCYH